MQIQRIDSPANDKIKRASRLSLSSKFRRETGSFLLEGLRLCTDAVKSKAEIKCVFVTDKALGDHSKALEPLLGAAGSVYLISDKCKQKLSDTVSSQGVFCVCGMRENGFEIERGGKYIAFENVQDPANLGAACRTAEALGISGALLCGCCDIYNPKALRASMGSLLRLPLRHCDDLAETLLDAERRSVKAYASTPSSSAQRIDSVSFDGGAVVVIGNEGNGVSERLMSCCRALTIPMLGTAQSLNASAAAGIIMWELMRERRG